MVKKIDLITLGCSKNLVDSERLLRQFELLGYEIHHDPDKITGDIVIVNTCGFIGDAKEESINMILELVEMKESGVIEKLFVMGCLSERYLHDLEGEIPSVDKFYGKFNWNELISDLGESYNEKASHERVLTTPSHYAYLKISEGCDRHCSYCAIPIITGRHKSIPIEELVQEVEHLVAKGVTEFQIIAQELTYYGVDLYKKQRLADLIDILAAIPGVKRLRLHYAYPSNFPMDVLRAIREHDNVCNYLDIALQHISDSQLKLMRRNVTKQQTIDLIAAMRREVPGIYIRTTMLVGHPGETEEDFEELLDFVRETRFDRLGAFAYSHEEGTYAGENYEDNVPEEVK
ncbi:MAG: 30S ribosomal protein S12 methylthiotransferase RimO, partial [Bacteroidaceae bacterium]